MSDYIEREAVEKMLENAQIITDGEYSGYCTEDVSLGSIPAADVAPVRHGRWIDSSNGWMCSECKQDNTYAKPWCPNCGAKMDAKEDEDAEPVVHCVDCIYLMFSDFYGECKRGYLGGVVRPDDYCSRGERKEDNT